jgi:hypothetical protein
MDRLSHTDFVIHNQPRLFIRALRDVLRQDPAVVLCTAHKIETLDRTYRLHIEATDPLQCLQNAANIIKTALIATMLDDSRRTVLPIA